MPGDDDTQDPNDSTPEDSQDDGGTPSYEDWFGGQEEGIQELITANEAGLRSALQSERDQRRDFEQQLRDTASELEQGSKARERLDAMVGDLELLERRADFYESAHTAGVTNLRLAWVAVQSDDDLTNKRGLVNMALLKKSYPELFGSRQAPPGNAGSGTDSPPASKQDMNQFIRASAGRG